MKTTVLYRDMRCVSPGAEELYRQARGAGVLFIRVPDDRAPEVVGTKTKAKGVVARDVMLGRDDRGPGRPGGAGGGHGAGHRDGRPR